MPANESKLNYRLIGFKLPDVAHAGKYRIEIAYGNYFTEDSFKRNIAKTYPIKGNKIIAEVPYFGASYTWRYYYQVKHTTIYSCLYHFSTTSVPEVDTNHVRLRIIQSAVRYKDDYVFLDGNRALYDMNGKPVWYLPNIKWSLDEKYILGDLKRSTHNTITYLSRGLAYEINYEGNILWKGSYNGKVSGDKGEHCHHEFTHLDNGHYMVLGSEINWKFPYTGNNLNDSNEGKKGYKPVEFGTLIEYDKNGDVVWSWKSSKYFLDQDPDFINPPPKYCQAFDSNFIGHFDYVHPNMERLRQDVHENAFFFDEKNNVIYVSFKNISEIIKLKYPEGTILNKYGPCSGETGIDLFCHQHSCRISKDGYLYLFNNNLCDTLPAKVAVFREPANAKEVLKKIWEYQCTVEGDNQTKFFSGGNVAELPDGSMFVNMGSDYSKVFIVNRSKKVLWSALPEKWNEVKKKWEIIHQARSSIISRQQLERLIWNSEIKE